MIKSGATQDKKEGTSKKTSRRRKENDNVGKEDIDREREGSGRKKGRVR